MYNSNCVFKLCKNISKVYNNSNAIYHLISQYNSNDWEKYIYNYTNIQNCLYKDKFINVSLIKWPTHYVINSFNTDSNTDSNTFIKILKGSLLKTEYTATDNVNDSVNVTGTDVVSSTGDPIYSLPYNVDTLSYKNNNLLFIKSNTIYSINNNIIINNNYPVSLHVNVTS